VVSASVFKVSVALEAETQFAEGRLDPRERVSSPAASRTPGAAGSYFLTQEMPDSPGRPTSGYRISRSPCRPAARSPTSAGTAAPLRPRVSQPSAPPARPRPGRDHRLTWQANTSSSSRPCTPTPTTSTGPRRCASSLPRRNTSDPVTPRRGCHVRADPGAAVRASGAADRTVTACRSDGVPAKAAPHASPAATASCSTRLHPPALAAPTASARPAAPATGAETGPAAQPAVTTPSTAAAARRSQPAPPAATGAAASSARATRASLTT
jgi:hypothetical protein